MSGKKVIFIGGSSYSGSTMLDMMLANNDQGFSAGEVHALFRPFRPHHFTPLCGCGDIRCELWDKVKKNGEKILYETLFDLLPNVSYIVDSSKDPWWITRQGMRLITGGFEVHNLLIWKEPGAFAHSMLKRKRRGWLKAWRNYYSVYLSLIDDYIPVSYSGLVQDPEHVLKGLCENMNMPFNNNQHNFWDKRHHTLFGNRSAKIHLLKKDGTAKYAPLPANPANVKHRSIYNDIEYKNNLPEEVNHHLSSDPGIKNIVTTLENGDSFLNNGHYDRFLVAKAKVKNQIKYALGSIIGKHWRII